MAALKIISVTLTRLLEHTYRVGVLLANDFARKIDIHQCMNYPYMIVGRLSMLDKPDCHIRQSDYILTASERLDNALARLGYI
jgi:hypothetical protein